MRSFRAPSFDSITRKPITLGLEGRVRLEGASEVGGGTEGDRNVEESGTGRAASCGVRMTDVKPWAGDVSGLASQFCVWVCRGPGETDDGFDVPGEDSPGSFLNRTCFVLDDGDGTDIGEGEMGGDFRSMMEPCRGEDRRGPVAVVALKSLGLDG